MQSHFEINVSLRGRHLFATASRSLDDMTARGERAAIELARTIADAFPDCQVEITRWDCQGTRVAPVLGPIDKGWDEHGPENDNTGLPITDL